MAYKSTVYNVMIASPSDVQKERHIVKEVVYEWNNINSQSRNITLLPLGWETHTVPILGGHPQTLINKQVLAFSDLLIAIFWTRIGTATEAAPSGTVEEIQEHIRSGKPALVYFSTVPVHPDSVDEKQYSALKELRELFKKQGLIEFYDSSEEFRQKFTRHLASLINTHDHFKLEVGTNVEYAEFAGDSTDQSSTFQLSKEAKELLLEAVQDPAGHILYLHVMGGIILQTNSKSFVERGNPRSTALWEHALEQLTNEYLIKVLGHEGEMFQVTHKGYQFAETLKKQK